MNIAMNIIDVVKQINFTIKNIAMYEFDHPTSKSAIERTFKMLSSFLLIKKALSLNSADKRLLIDGKAMNLNDPLSTEFNNLFCKHNIAGVTFQNGLPLKEFSIFLKIMAAKSEAVKKQGGIKGILSKGNFTHLRINEIQYTRTEEDQGVYEIEEKDESLFEIPSKEEITTRTPFEAEILREIRSLTESGADYQSIFKDIIEKFHEEIEATTGRLKKEIKKVGFEKKRTESVIRSLSDGLVVVDDKGKVLMMNPAAENILEASRDEKVGTGLLEGLKEYQMVSMSGALKEDDEQKTKEINIGGEEDTQKTVRTSMAVVENEDGKTIGMVATLTDITKQKELEQMKSDFLSRVSHELRSPMAVMKQAISVVLDGDAGAISPEQSKFLSMAKRNIERLFRLINDLLDLSKLEAKKMELNCKPERIDKVLEEVISTFQLWASKKKINISSHIPDQLPIISFDWDKITQVLTNLLSNALKFTPEEGKISLSANKPDENTCVMVYVADSGSGIAKENLEKVFDKFVQVENKGVREIKGTGLGLPIVREIVELHKGKIWAESPLIDGQSGKECTGSRFVFTLPVENNH